MPINTCESENMPGTSKAVHYQIAAHSRTVRARAVRRATSIVNTIRVRAGSMITLASGQRCLITTTEPLVRSQWDQANRNLGTNSYLCGFEDIGNLRVAFSKLKLVLELSYLYFGFSLRVKSINL